VPLRDMPAKDVRYPAAVDNDVKLAGVGGIVGGGFAVGTADFVFIAIGTGVGAGIVLDGKLFGFDVLPRRDWLFVACPTWRRPGRRAGGRAGWIGAGWGRN